MIDERSARRRFRPQVAPVIARVKGRRLSGWGLEKGAAAPAASTAASTEPLEDLDADPIRLHRPANHRVPNVGRSVR